MQHASPTTFEPLMPVVPARADGRFVLLDLGYGLETGATPVRAQEAKACLCARSAAFLRSHEMREANMQLRMSEAEKVAFRSFASRAGSYFEFGIGGSTYAAAELVKGRVVAIDSDPEWVDKARNALGPSAYERTLLLVDIGPTREWGYPTGGLGSEQHGRYYNAIVEHQPQDFDFCLVDGRFRIACLIAALRSTRSDTVVAFHDYRCRPHYHPAEQFGRVIYEAEDISFFVRRPGVSNAELDRAKMKYGKDAR